MPSEPRSAASMPCSRCSATPETGQTEGCPECEGVVGPLNDGLPLSQRRVPSAAGRHETVVQAAERWRTRLLEVAYRGPASRRLTPEECEQLSQLLSVLSEKVAP